SAALTGRAPATAAEISRNRTRDTGPSAPAAGSLASMRSAPPASAAAASSALRTLTSSCIDALLYHLMRVNQPLEGRAMLVTGASSGIGRAIAIAAARAGADVAITYRENRDGASQTAREIEALGRRTVPLR